MTVISETTLVPTGNKTGRSVLNSYLPKIEKERPDIHNAIEALKQDVAGVNAENKELRESTAEFLDLVSVLLYLENHPSNREQARVKAEFCVNYLAAGGIRADVIEQSKLFNVLATVGVRESEVDENTVKGMILVHHDTVAKSADEIKAEYTRDEAHPELSRFVHPWVLDDTIHVASAMMSAVHLQKLRNANPEQVNACVQLVISDWEEFNTRGMQELSPYLQESGRLLEDIDFVLDGESTAEEMGIAVVFRGKGVRTVEAKLDRESTVVDAFLDFASRYRFLQKRAFSQAQLTEADDVTEIASPTAVAATVVEFNPEQLFAYLEMRTNSNCSVADTASHAQAAFDQDFYKSDLPLGIKGEIHWKPRQVFVATRDEATNTTTLAIKTGHDQHPGKYMPDTRADSFSAVEVLINSLTEAEKTRLKSINIGSKNKPNTVPGSAEVVFEGALDLEDLLPRISTSVDTQNSTLRPWIPEDSAIQWSVNQTDVPDRECPRPAESIKKLAELMERSLLAGFSEIAKGLPAPEISRSPFDAMIDAGALSINKAIFDQLFPDGFSKTITWGAGNFYILHGQEHIDVRTVLIALSQIPVLADVVTDMTVPN